MGHASVGNLDRLFIRQIFAYGKVSISSAVKFAIKKKQTLHAGEGEYKDQGMLEFGLSEIVLFHALKWNHNMRTPMIEAVSSSPVVEKFLKTGLSDLTETETIEFTNIEWKFSKGSRRKYLEKSLPSCDYIEN